MDIRLELIPVPVSDVDRAKNFYTDQLGFVADHDHRVTDELRFVQLTPPGSACSIAIGTGITDMAAGSMRGLQVVVDDIDETKTYFADRGLDAGEVDDQPWGRFLYLTDPDGNSWSVQQIVRPS